MPKIDPAKIQELKQRQRQLEDRRQEVSLAWAAFHRELEALGLFCDECGETEPPDNFYPLWSYGPDSLTGLHCNACERRMRGETNANHLRPEG